jgi:hypothetical protein
LTILVKFAICNAPATRRAAQDRPLAIAATLQATHETPHDAAREDAAREDAAREGDARSALAVFD